MVKTTKPSNTKNKGNAPSPKHRASKKKSTVKAPGNDYNNDGYTTPTETAKTKSKGSASSSKSHASRSTTTSINKTVKSIDLGSDAEDGGNEFNMMDIDWSDIDAIKAGVLVIKPEWDQDDIEVMTTKELHEVLFNAMDIKTFKECYMALSTSGGVFCSGLNYRDMKDRLKSMKSTGKSSRCGEIKSLLKELQTKKFTEAQKKLVHEKGSKTPDKITKSSSRSVASTAESSSSDSEQSSEVEIISNSSIKNKGKKNKHKQSKCDDNRVSGSKTSPPKKIKIEPGTQGSDVESTLEDTNATPQKPRAKNTKKEPEEDSKYTMTRGETTSKAPPQNANLKTLTAFNENSNDDSDDPLSGIDLSKSVIKSTRRGNAMTIVVSNPFFCAIPGNDKKMHVVVFFLNQPMLWYLKPDFIMITLNQIQKKRELFKTESDWMMEWKNTFGEFKARVPYTQDDILSRNRNNKTTSHFSFVLEMGIDDDVHTKVQGAMTTISSIFKLRHGKTNCGCLFMEYLKMYGQQTLLDWLIKSMGNGDEKATAERIATEMDTYLGRGMLTYEWNSTLDRMWPNFEIKQFLVDHVGVKGWEDMGAEEKKKVFRAYKEDSPEVLPKWDAITKQPWS